MFSFFFVHSEAQIPCECIQGITKSSTYKLGNMNGDEMQGHWNSIRLDKIWYLLNPLWICRPELGPTGKILDQKSKISGEMDEYFFLSKPKEYIYWCYPDDDKWQLLQHAVSRDTFLTLPLLRPQFFRHGLSLLSRRECVLESTDGSFQLKIESPKDIAMTNYFWFELSIVQGSTNQSDNDGNNQKSNTQEKEYLKQLQNFVVMSNFLNTWSFDISFPLEGIFEMDIKMGEGSDSLKSVALFRIFCLARKSVLRSLPVNPQHVGFGPGTETRKAGLMYPSHRHGVYGFAPGDRVDISFRINKDVIDTTLFECSLRGNTTGKHSSEIVKVTQEVKTKVNISTGELKFQTNIAQNGLYVLMINAYDKSAVDNTKSKNVCNYLFTTDFADMKKREVTVSACNVNKPVSCNVTNDKFCMTKLTPKINIDN